METNFLCSNSDFVYGNIEMNIQMWTENVFTWSNSQRCVEISTKDGFIKRENK
jgi:hypothetical protein